MRKHGAGDDLRPSRNAFSVTQLLYVNARGEASPLFSQQNPRKIGGPGKPGNAVSGISRTHEFPLLSSSKQEQNSTPSQDSLPTISLPHAGSGNLRLRNSNASIKHPLTILRCSLGTRVPQGVPARNAHSSVYRTRSAKANVKCPKCDAVSGARPWGCGPGAVSGPMSPPPMSPPGGRRRHGRAAIASPMGLRGWVLSPNYMVDISASGE